MYTNDPIACIDPDEVHRDVMSLREAASENSVVLFAAMMSEHISPDGECAAYSSVTDYPVTEKSISVSPVPIAE